MKELFKFIKVLLFDKVRKDVIIFFASSGVIVGLLMILHHILKETGWASGDPWADALFLDFFSFNAFGFLLLGLMAIGSLATLMNALGWQWRRLEDVVVYLESVLVQLAFTIISFTMGLSVVALLHSVFTCTGGGAKLAFVVIVWLTPWLLIVLVIATLVTRRDKPFDRWWASLLMLLLVLGVVAWIIIRGVK